MLNLAEELFLLALNDEKGTLHGAASYLPYGLAGALLAELALAGKIGLDKDRKLIILDATSSGDELLDDAMTYIAASKKPRKLTVWVNTLNNKKYRRRVATRLVQKGILQRQEKKYIWVIPYVAYPQQDASAKYWIKQHMRAMILAAEKPEPRGVILLSLVQACQMSGLVFTRDERKMASRGIKALVKGEIFGEAVAQVIEEIEAATAAAVIAVAASS